MPVIKLNSLGPIVFNSCYTATSKSKNKSQMKVNIFYFLYFHSAPIKTKNFLINHKYFPLKTINILSISDKNCKIQCINIY